MDVHSSADPVETLRRWEATGAVWRVLSAREDEVTVGLFTCDGAEEMSRFTTDDVRLRSFLAGHGGDASYDGGR
jgi:hypothetical protein